MFWGTGVINIDNSFDVRLGLADYSVHAILHCVKFHYPSMWLPEILRNQF